MFTGIIEETGCLQAVKKGVHSSVLTIRAQNILNGTEIGDSIAVNGVCLTVTALGQNCFTADVMHETLNRSSLGKLTAGAPVNLERAMAADGRFGGHIVSGHIDGTGTITHIQKDDNAVWYTISASGKLLRYVIEKGSVAIDGISLTVAAVSNKDFQVSVIPHTTSHTALSGKKTGDIVNLENDCIGKYVERLMTFDSSDGKIPDNTPGKISEAFLGKYGFL